MAVPGCPELAFCTPSIANVRMVFMHSPSRVVSIAIYIPPLMTEIKLQEISVVSYPFNLDAYGELWMRSVPEKFPYHKPQHKINVPLPQSADYMVQVRTS